MREIARKEGVDSSYMSRMVNLTTLAPDIVAAILDATASPEVTVFNLAVEPPALWEDCKLGVRVERRGQGRPAKSEK